MLRFVSQWELQPARGIYQLQRCSFVCPEAALLLDAASLLERFTRPDADGKELTRIAKFFCEVNHRPGDRERGATAAKLWLQECLALACACEVLASSFPIWRIIGPKGEPLMATSALSIAQSMLGTPDTAVAAAGDPRVTESKRKRKKNFTDEPGAAKTDGSTASTDAASKMSIKIRKKQKHTDV